MLQNTFLFQFIFLHAVFVSYEFWTIHLVDFFPKIRIALCMYSDRLLLEMWMTVALYVVTERFSGYRTCFELLNTCFRFEIYDSFLNTTNCRRQCVDISIIDRFFIITTWLNSQRHRMLLWLRLIEFSHQFNIHFSFNDALISEFPEKNIS